MLTRVVMAGALAIGLLLGAHAAAGGGPGGFTFSPPAGWVDISRGAPEAQRQKAPRLLLVMADAPQIAFCAYNPSSADPMKENVNAVIIPGDPASVTTSAGLAALKEAVEAEIRGRKGTYRSLKVEVVKVAGVTAGRLVGVINETGAAVQYAIPGARGYAMLTFSTTLDKLARSERLFDAAAQATRGAIEPPRKRPIGK